MSNNSKTNQLLMFVGVPLSGKSTFIQTHANDFYYYHIVSSDDLIEAVATELDMTYSDVWQDVAKLATKAMNIQLDKAIQKRDNIIWDQTNLTVESRRKKLARFPACYSKIAVYFDVPTPDLLSDRNQTRNKNTGKWIPPEAIQKMISDYQVPDLSEGFDEIWHVDNHGILI